MVTRWWHQGGNTLDQLQWRERDLVHLGATLVTAWLAMLFGAAVHQGDAVFANSAIMG